MKKNVNFIVTIMILVTSVFASSNVEILGVLVDDESIITFSDESLISQSNKDYVTLATSLGIISGNNGKFNPQANVTRAEFTKIIAEMLDYDTSVTYNNTFSDVKPSDWYANYVEILSEKDVITGSDGKFRPNDNINLEEMAVILTRAMNISHTEYNTSDLHNVSDYAKSSMGFMLENNILTKENSTNSKNIVNREFATMVVMKSYLYLNDVDSTHSQVKSSIKNTTNYLLEKVTDPTFSVIGGEWTILGLAQSGEKISNEYFNKYYSNVSKALLLEHSKETRKFSNKVTETQRASIALKAIGKDPQNIDGINLIDYTINKSENMPDLPLHQKELGDRQGLNELSFGLITIDLIYGNENEEINKLRNDIINKILTDYRTSSGGFALGKGSEKIDIDMTAMTITALSPYYNQKNYENVTKAIDESIVFLSEMQNDNGTFSNGYAPSDDNSKSLESIAQVVIALSSVGIDSDLDERFVKNGNSLIDTMYEFYLENGNFEHIKGDNGSQMATEQGYLAFISYDRFKSGKSPIYDM